MTAREELPIGGHIYRNIIEYAVVSAESLIDLGHKVTDELNDFDHGKEGWELYGDPFIKGVKICQAMTRNNPIKPEEL